MILNSYRYATGGGGSWEYASLAIAEASGDAWQDGDDIQITSGALFLYYSALDTNGHSGLIHKDPYDDSSVVSAVALRVGEGPGVDPDSWSGPGWDYSLAITTKGVDYDFDASGSRSRIRKLTGGGRAMIVNTSLNTADTEYFIILRDCSCIELISSGSQAWAYAYAHKDSSNRNEAHLVADDAISTSNWYLNANSNTATSKAKGTEAHIWLYVTDGKCALWFDADATAEVKDTSQADAAARSRCTNIGAGLNTSAGTSDMKFSTVLHGGLTSA